jgi:thiol-disulfide isomerase/thioredoxin
MSIARRQLPRILLTTALALAPLAASAQADIELISQGREVTLEQHLVPGKLVVFDFFADWCAPCRVVTPRLERLAAQHPARLALRKIDVIDWESPVARQHRVGSLPYLVLYGADGRRLAAGDANRVMAALGSHLGGASTALSGAGPSPAVPAAVWIILIAALVIGSLWLRARGQRPAPGSGAPSAATAEGGPEVWFVLLDGGLDGPFSVEQLATLRSSGRLRGEARVRRRGESTWRRLDDVAGQS